MKSHTRITKSKLDFICFVCLEDKEEGSPQVRFQDVSTSFLWASFVCVCVCVLYECVHMYMGGCACPFRHMCGGQSLMSQCNRVSH